MNLFEARTLKAALRAAGSEAADGKCPRFAVGIELPPPGETKYKVVAYLFEGVTYDDATKRVLNKYSKDIVVEQIERAVIRMFYKVTERSLSSRFAHAARSMIQSLSRDAETRPLEIGMSVSHKTGGGGTLGFFAKDADGRRGIVSCNHVIALADRAGAGEAIVSPGVEFGRNRKNVACLRDYPKLFTSGLKKVDAAFAELVTGQRYVPGKVDGRTLTTTAFDPQVITPVAKHGARTQFREGFVVAKEIDCFPADYGATPVRFENVMRIKSRTRNQFADEGDSGALVYTTGTQTAQPMGLLFYDGPKFSWMNPIADVERELNVKLIVDVNEEDRAG